MSFSYFVFCEDENRESFSFPEELSGFFEQYGGYDHQSEVAQLSELLQIDLSVFQQYDMPESDEVTWHKISAVKNKVQEFISKLEAAPLIFQSINYGSEASQFANALMRVAQSSDLNRLKDMIAKMQENPQVTYPPDRGYIQSKRIVTDLEALNAKLELMENEGVKKIKFIYM